MDPQLLPILQNEFLFSLRRRILTYHASSSAYLRSVCSPRQILLLFKEDLYLSCFEVDRRLLYHRGIYSSLMFHETNGYLIHAPRFLVILRPFFKEEGPISFTYIYIMLHGIDPSYDFCIATCSAYVTRTNSKTHICSRGFNFLLEDLFEVLLLSSRSLLPRSPDSFLEAPIPSGNCFPSPRCLTLKSPIYPRGTSRPLYEALLISEVLLPSSRSILRSYLPPQHIPRL